MIGPVWPQGFVARRLSCQCRRRVELTGSSTSRWGAVARVTSRSASALHNPQARVSWGLRKFYAGGVKRVPKNAIPSVGGRPFANLCLATAWRRKRLEERLTAALMQLSSEIDQSSVGRTTTSITRPRRISFSSMSRPTASAVRRLCRSSTPAKASPFQDKTISPVLSEASPATSAIMMAVAWMLRGALVVPMQRNGLRGDAEA